MMRIPSLLALALALAPVTGQLASADEWRPLDLEHAPTPREDHTTIWTGREAIVWGGVDAEDRYLADGAAYRPATGTWRSISTAGAPSVRAWHTAVWTGREMLIWGGDSNQGERGDGGAYNPTTDRWRPISTKGAPTPRASHAAAFTGTHMIVWAGVDENHAFPKGGAYDPVKDRWRPLQITTELPTPRTLTGLWTGREFLAWGGINGSSVLGHGVAFDPVKRKGTLLPDAGAPSGRVRHAAVWTGQRMLVWGGSRSIMGGLPLGDGASFDPVQRRWSALATRSAPPPRYGHGFAWTGSELWIVGGATQRQGDALRDSWAFHAEKGWRRLPDLPEPRAAAHAIATPHGVVLFGGRDAAKLRRGGYRYVLGGRAQRPHEKR